MIITVLGSGTSVPQADRSAPAYLVEGEGGVLMVDLGPGSIWNLVRLSGRRLAEVELVLITHLHLDHVADLAPMLFAMRAAEIDRRAPLLVVGPEGFNDYYSSLRGIYGQWVEGTGYDLEVRQWSEKSLEWGGFRVESAYTTHSRANLAYLLHDPGSGGSVLFTGDGEPTRGVIQLARDRADVLICECTLPAGILEKGHMNPGQAGVLAGELNVKRLILSHLRQGFNAPEAEEAAKAGFSGEIIIAVDGMKISV